MPGANTGSGKNRGRVLANAIRALGTRISTFLRGIERPVHNDGRGGALLGAHKVVFVLGKGQIARLRAVGRGKALDEKGGIAEDLAPEVFGNFSSGKRHIA